MYTTENESYTSNEIRMLPNFLNKKVKLRNISSFIFSFRFRFKLKKEGKKEFQTKDKIIIIKIKTQPNTVIPSSVIIEPPSYNEQIENNWLSSRHFNETFTLL